MVRFRPEAPIKYADVAHLVERHLAKVEVAGSSPVIRSKGKERVPKVLSLFLCIIHYSSFTIHYSFRRQAFDISQIITNSLFAIGVPLCFGSEGLFFRSGYKKRLLGSEKKHLNIHTYYIDKMKKHAKMTKIKKCI